MQALGHYLSHEDILLGVQASSQRELFEQVGAHLTRVHGLAGASIAAALQRRELAESTALGHGIAIPHARIKGDGPVRLVYVRLASPMPFKAPDGKAVSELMVLIVPEPEQQDHLQLLAQLASLLSDEHFRTTLRACTQLQELAELMTHGPG